MTIISFIEAEQLVKKFFKHLDIRDLKRKPPPCVNSPPIEAFILYDDSPTPGVDDYLIDVDYPIETYL